ncbi:hypothetical protein SKAU_G00080400 [Synaphobranchus kaupii]|uniref:Uncharacterized protein n=1 Tax=Synaphobranchus kaupii TaxID=118154 RepID=A0A9Q1J4E9_SYNKA|nr:hypothetical protein SKAU_G00080400 [Synaphobranchus kaupii]
MGDWIDSCDLNCLRARCYAAGTLGKKATSEIPGDPEKAASGSVSLAKLPSSDKKKENTYRGVVGLTLNTEKSSDLLGCTSAEICRE